MKKFIISVLTFIVSCILIFATVAFVKYRLQSNSFDKSLQTKPRREILFMGDSHIGCSFIEKEKYKNCILWSSAISIEYVYLGLLELSRCGRLDDINTIVFEIGPQLLCEQKKEHMSRFFWSMTSLTLRYLIELPLPYNEKLTFATSRQIRSNPQVFFNVSATNNVPIMNRTEVERDRDLCNTIASHFMNIDCDYMCTDWEKCVKTAIYKIKEFCDGRNIKLIFFSAPVTKQYCREIPGSVDKKIQEMVDFIEKLGIPYYDLKMWGDENDFKDCHHLRADGAKKFTAWFYKTILMMDVNDRDK